MIRVDSIEQYKELREQGFNGDILVLMKGGEKEIGRADNTETGDGKDNIETGDGKEDTKKDVSVQLDYEKIIEGVTEKIKPLIQETNRTKGNGVENDENLNDIMKKFAEM